MRADWREIGIVPVSYTHLDVYKRQAKYIAEKAGVDDFIAEAKPEDKMEYIKKEQQAGKLVAMMGDVYKRQGVVRRWCSINECSRL